MSGKILKYFLWIIGAVIIGIFTSYGIWALGDLVFLKPVIYQSGLAETIAAKPKTPIYKISGTSSYYVKDKNKKLKLSAGAMVVGDIESGEIIFSRNKNIRYPIASVSKLITALVARDMIRDKDVIANAVEKTWAVYGHGGAVKSRENIEVADFLNPLLLQSSNKVAEILADTAGFAQFIRLMNDQTLALGMTATILEEPSGLSAQNKSTADDLFRLAIYLGNSRPDILKITLKNKEESLGRTWFNTSRFLSGYGYLGGKTGYTDAAKYTLLSIFEVKIGSERRNIAIILLQSSDRPGDVNRIINYLKDNIIYKKSLAVFPESFPQLLGEGSDPPPPPKETALVKLPIQSGPNKEESKEEIPCPKSYPEVADMSLFNVSRENSLRDYVPKNLISLSKNITNGLSFCLERETAEALSQMLKAASSDGLIMAVTSAYRAVMIQEGLYNNAGEKNSGEYLLIAAPEHSEHQLGTTVDLTGHSISYEKTTFFFEDSPEYAWLENNADKFGFVQSYPKGKENITGYQAEPWHWRYVGPEIAQKIKESGITIVEFLSDQAPQIGG